MNETSKYKFSTIIKNSDFIVRDHQVHNVRIMPGVTFLDLIYRFLMLKMFNTQEVELRNILFINAVATTISYDKKIQFVFKKTSDHWVIVAKSQKIKDNQALDQIWEENFKCELHLNKKLTLKTIDIPKLRDSATKKIDMATIYDYARKLNINHYIFMKGLGQIYKGKSNVLAEIFLSELAFEFIDYFYLHPAYLDASTLIPFISQNIQDNDFTNVKPYIPIYIESFHAIEKLNEKCFVYIREPVTINPQQDIIYSDYELYNSDGKIVATFKKLAAKMIRSEELIKRLEMYSSSSSSSSSLKNEKDEVKNSPIALDLILDKPNKQISKWPDQISGNEQNLKEFIKMDLRQMVARVSNKQIDEINPEKYFYDLGLDSIKLLQLVAELEKKMGVELYPTLLFEYANIEELSGYIEKEYGLNYKNSTKINTDTKSDNVPANTLYYQNVWEKLELNFGLVNKNKLGTIAIFDVNKGLYNCLKKGLESNELDYSSILLIKPGKKYQDLGNQIYTINPENKEDYRILLNKLKKQNLMPAKIIYFWSHKNSAINANSFDNLLNKGLYSILHLSQTLMEHKPKDEIILIYLYKYLNEITDSFHSAFNGFAKTINLENPKFFYKTVGVSSHSTDEVGTILLKELFAGKDYEIEIRYNKSRRNVKQLQEVELEKVITGNLSSQSAELKKNGVYLITGGTGALGLIFAEHLARQVSAKIVLTGRSELSDEKEKQIKQLEYWGSEVKYFKADISILEEAHKLINYCKSNYKKIDGIIHCAGIIEDNFIIKKTIEEMKNVIAPKVFGTIHLDEVTKDENLDFFILFSSMSSIIGNPGQSDYAFGNCFMDSYAEAREVLNVRKKRKGKTLSINWPFWKEGGMKINSQIMVMLEKTVGIQAFETITGLNSFDLGLKFKGNQFLVVSGNHRKIKKALRPNEISNKSDSKIKDIKSPEGPLTIIDISDPISNVKDFNFYWENFDKNSKLSKLQNRFSMDYVHLLLKHSNKHLHFLLDTSFNIKIEVSIYGQGKPIVLLPAFGMTTPIWSNQIVPLSKKYQIIVINLPGHGLSERCSDITLSNISSMIMDVLNVLNVDTTVHLIGASFGGLIAQMFAKNYPEKLNSLILTNSFNRVKSMQVVEMLEKFWNLTKMDIDKVKENSNSKDIRNNWEKYYNQLVRCHSIDPLMALNYMDQLSSLSTTEFMSEIKTPTFIISGQHDAFRDVLFEPGEAELLHSQIPNSKLYIMNEAGHFPYITHYRQFNNKIKAFMAEQEFTV